MTSTVVPAIRVKMACCVVRTLPKNLPRTSHVPHTNGIYTSLLFEIALPPEAPQIFVVKQATTLISSPQHKQLPSKQSRTSKLAQARVSNKDNCVSCRHRPTRRRAPSGRPTKTCWLASTAQKAVEGDRRSNCTHDCSFELRQATIPWLVPIGSPVTKRECIRMAGSPTPSK